MATEETRGSPKTAGQALAEWRDGAGKTQTDCATAVGVKQPAWSDWEKGAKNPQVKYALRIERLTGGAVPVALWEPEEPTLESRETGT